MAAGWGEGEGAAALTATSNISRYARRFNALRSSGDDKQGVYVARTANCFANRNSACGFFAAARVARRERAQKNGRGFARPVKPRAVRVYPFVINFTLSRTTIFTLAELADIDAHRHTLE